MRKYKSLNLMFSGDKKTLKIKYYILMIKPLECVLPRSVLECTRSMFKVKGTFSLVITFTLQHENNGYLFGINR
jgi:hypothetical protein